MPEHLHKRKHLTSFQLIILGFAGVILIGALILTLPVSSASGVVTPFDQALFTSTSAVCVTGLVVQDTGSYWSIFGQAVILALIQIGGLGVVTVAVSVFMLSGRKISLMQRSTMQDAISAPKVGGIVRLTKFILRGTFLIEALGAVLLFPVFCRDFGIKGIWMSVFHSISAFCNAGFDIMGKYKPYSSFTAYYDDPVVSFTLCALILIGGIGFIVWSDIIDHKWHFKKYALQTKMVLSFSAVLVFGGALLFYLLERNNLYADMSTTGIICSSFFSVITPRTAGFNTLDIGAFTEGGKLLTIILMFIGGGSGSTAGGVKMATIFVLLLHLRSTLLRTTGTNIFGRRIEDDTITKASALLCTYLFAGLAATLAICGMQGFSVGDTLFEVISAICTAGMTAGLTSQLNFISRLIIIFLMYIGRLGSLSFALSFTDHKKLTHIMQPVERINIG